MIKKLLPYLKNYKKYAILSPILMIIEVFTDILVPYLMSFIVDVGIANRDVGYVMKMGLIMVGVTLFAMVIGIISTHLGAQAGYGFAKEIRGEAFRRIQRFSFANLDRMPTATLITRLTNDCNTLGQVMMMTLRMAVRAPFLMIFALIMATFVNLSLAKVFFVVIPTMALMTFIILRMSKPLFEKIQERVDRVNSVIQENLTGVRVVKSFNRQEYAQESFGKRNEELKESSLKAISVFSFMMPILNLLIYGCIIAVLWFGGHQVMVGTMHQGELISFITYITQIMMALMLMTMYFMSATRGVASAKRVVEILEEDPDIYSPENPVCELEDGSIHFRKVGFRYPGNSEDTLSDINLSIESGEIIGIIGSTGSAKSSLVQLIPRLYDVDCGEVFVGGKNVKEYDLEALRDQVAFVLQQNVLFSGTIRENMLWGDADATDEKIIRVLQQAQAWEFVSQYEKGLDHPVEQGGTNFSGGQRQRLAIARGLMKNPKIMILDDSTSAVDVATDAKIRQVFSDDLQGITTLIIAQRVSSISESHKIVVMEEGRIDAIGTHRELLQSSSIYRQIYNSQQKGVLAA